MYSKYTHAEEKKRTSTVMVVRADVVFHTTQKEEGNNVRPDPAKYKE